MKNSHNGMVSVEALLAIAAGALILMGVMQMTASSFLPKLNETVATLLNPSSAAGGQDSSAGNNSDSQPVNSEESSTDATNDPNSQDSEHGAPNTSDANGEANDERNSEPDGSQPDNGDAIGSTDERPFPDDVRARREEISDLLRAPSTSEEERIRLLAELTEIDRNHMLQQADQLETEARRLDIQASVADALQDSERADQLRADAERKKLEAAEIRDGARGIAGAQKQIDAANAMRDLLDFADNFSEALPEPVEKVYDWVKYPIRDGLPQITEEILSAEQYFQRWLNEKVSDSPMLSEKVDRVRQTLNDFLKR